MGAFFVLNVMYKSVPFISFPERYLGERPVKFPLLVNHPGYFAINKPAGIACFRHDWTLGTPDVSMALRREILNKKPQLKNLGLEGLFRVFKLDAELSGALIYAKTVEWEDILRNAFGSRQIVFRYHFLATTESEERERFCDLPLAEHSNQEQMLVSHKTGKKCETELRYLRSFGRYQLWEAETSDFRMHQLRLHAAERDLQIVGEDLYSKGERIFLSMIKRGYRQNKGTEEPIYDHLAAHLVSVEFKVPDQELPSAFAPLPRGFEVLLKFLERHRGQRS